MLIIIIRALWINRMPKRMIVVLWELSLLILSVPIGFGTAREPEALSSVVSELTSDIFIGQEVLEAATARDGVSGFPVLWAIWLAGALSLALFFAVSYIRCLREYKTAEIYTDGFLTEWLKAHALKRTVTVKVTGAVTSPMTYGIIRPVILLPKTLNIQNKEQLYYILLHEFCHIRRFDILIKLWANAVLCIHWFNPLVWAMRSLLIRDIELGCDESVLNELGINSRKDYAMMLIELQEQRSGFSPIGSGIGKSAIAERIEAIMKYKKYKPAALFIAAAILVSALMLSVFAVDRAISAGKTECEAEALAKETEEAEGYEVLEMNSDGVCYVKMTPSPNGYDYEYGNFAFKGTVIFTDENGEPFNVVLLGDKDNISITSLTVTP